MLIIEKISQVANSYYSVLGNSYIMHQAPVEQLFSAAGKVFRPERCRLNCERHHFYRIFVHFSSKYLKDYRTMFIAMYIVFIHLIIMHITLHDYIKQFCIVLYFVLEAFTSLKHLCMLVLQPFSKCLRKYFKHLS